MRHEVKSAVDFLSNIMRSRCLNNRKVEVFRQALQTLLCSHYQDHWFPEKPFKGSGYRCIRINHKMDPLVSLAGTRCGMSENELFDNLPKELTLWVDPKEVSYRIGEDGSVGVLFDNETCAAESGSQSNNNQETESQQPQQQQQQPQQQQQQPQQQQPTDFTTTQKQSTDLLQKQSTDLIQSCKDQLRYLGLSQSPADAINFEYLATFVAS